MGTILRAKVSGSGPGCSSRQWARAVAASHIHQPVILSPRRRACTASLRRLPCGARWLEYPGSDMRHDGTESFASPPPLVALAGWLLPGAGYWLIGQRTRAITVGTTILTVFVLGILVSGI